MVAAAYAAPSADADAEADPAILASGHLGFAGLHHAGVAAVHTAPLVHAAPAPLVHAAPAPLVHAAPVLAHHAAPICATESVILVTQTCTPTAENVCSTETVETEEIEYEKICKDVVDTLCDAGYHHGLYKREADAEADADAYYGGLAYGYGHHAAAPLAVAHHAAPVAVAHHAAPVAVAHHVAPAVHLPVASAVAHSAVATVKHACREVTTTHCVDNPKVKIVPVEVEHCHTITKVACADVENALPKTTCEAVETTHTVGLGYGHHAGYVAGHGW